LESSPSGSKCQAIAWNTYPIGHACASGVHLPGGRRRKLGSRDGQNSLTVDRAEDFGLLAEQRGWRAAKSTAGSQPPDPPRNRLPRAVSPAGQAAKHAHSKLQASIHVCMKKQRLTGESAAPGTRSRRRGRLSLHGAHLLGIRAVGAEGFNPDAVLGEDRGHLDGDVVAVAGRREPTRATELTHVSLRSAHPCTHRSSGRASPRPSSCVGHSA
jgi:hypothetical protein